jgi:hypothetical protein
MNHELRAQDDLHTVVHSRTFWDSLQAFFFEPSLPHTLAAIRIATGLMIAYIHLIWMRDLASFLGPNALIDNATWRAIHFNGSSMDYKWTYLAYTESMTFAWCHEIVAMFAGLLLALGWKTRYTCIAAWFMTLMMAHRMTGMLFGLDQVTLMLVMYLCLGRSGDVWSWDSRSHDENVERPIHWSNTMSTRLIQLHLCVIYLFGGIGKMRGEMWWDGSAMWYSVASYEYQSLDMTWMGHMAIVSSIATHLTVFWEFSYCALVWPTRSRPWVLAVALLVHGGIALFLGMITFGLMMIVANLAFVTPHQMRWLIHKLQSLRTSER